MDLKRWSRLQYFWTCIGPFFKVLGVLYALLGLAVMAREFIPFLSNVPVLQAVEWLCPWSWQTWIVLGFGLFFLAFVEGSYRYYTALQAEAKKTERPLIILRHEPPAEPVRKGKHWMLPLLVVLAGAIYWSVRIGAHHGYRLVDTKTPATPVSQPMITVPPPSKPLALMFRKELTVLPFPIAAETTLYVLQTHPEIRGEFYEFRNSGSTPLLWPRVRLDLKNLKKSDFWPSGRLVPQEVVKCTVTDTGDAAVQNAIMKFGLSFRTSGSKDAPTVSAHSHVVVIPFLKPYEQFSFYIVNQSPLTVLIDYPTTATVQIPGESILRTVQLTPPLDTFLSLVPWPLSPTRYHWIGVPELDQPSQSAK